MKVNNTLILGGTGFIGSALTKILKNENHYLHLTVRDGKYSDEPNIKHHNISIKAVDALADLIENEDISTIIHCASNLIPSSQFVDFYAENENLILPTISLLDKIKNKEILYVYFSSGGVIYGNHANIPTNETAPLNPLSYYGLSKKIIEGYLHFYSSNFKINHLIIRPSNPYGSDQHKDGVQGFIATVLHKIINGMPIEIWGDGSIIRDYITIDDLAWATKELINKRVQNETFNIGSGDGHSLLDVINVISNITSLTPNLTFSSARNIDVKTVILDIKKLQGEINFIATPLVDGIRNFYQKIS
ncbi:NAD-dependent epimerase/dehydratase family protein [Vogesella sp. LYT5W]|uniref:NAD-dependent epimerase/dehydratase family protein n=1 Tax=Vogesella margarita TaxID=2984199 RepID=A0ABT5IQT3_9NEIS|nr:NAD-dependent epimerase/dehydratase family protein [Vogesella margarita]MDC7714635.1 NAD-dependent epimerase/dehydratase family protein [Vogesella margarita]